MLALLSWISALRFPILFGVLMLVIGIWENCLNELGSDFLNIMLIV